MRKYQRYIFWIFLILLVVVRYFTTRSVYKDSDVIKITAKVASEPIKYENSQYIKLQGLKIYLPLYPEINYGDLLVVQGKVNLSKKSLQDIKLVEIKESDNFLYAFRKRIVDFYQKTLPEPHSSLIAGITLGSKSSIPIDFWESLKRSGTAHVVVASGMNVSLVAGFLISLFVLFLPRGKAIPFTLVGIWIYVILCGFEAPIIRAAIMGSIAITAVSLGRLAYAFRSLLLTVCLMLIVNPDWISDLGFLLSFTATASLLIFESRLRRLISFVPGIFREGLSTSLAAQIAVFPILYYTFGYFNPISPLINALILWTVPIITIIGMISGLIGIAVEPVGRVILFLSFPLTSWFILIIQRFD